jgi:hypothetical protein
VPAGLNRRGRVRVRGAWHARVRVIDRDGVARDEMAARTEDVSVAGALVAVPRAIFRGTTLELELSLAEDLDVTSRARVVHIIPRESERMPYAVGIAFMPPLPTPLEGRLRAFLLGHARRTGQGAAPAAGSSP